MKKIMTILLAFVASTSMYAQGLDKTFEFCDKDGNVYENGSELTFYDVHVDPDDGTAVLHAPLYVKSTTDEGGYVGITCKYTDMPSGTFKICFPNKCIPSSRASNEIVTDAGGAESMFGDPKPLTKSDAARDLETAWTDIKGYGSFNVTYQINVYKQVEEDFLGVTRTNYEKIADGSTITVKFLYADPAGINAMQNGGEKKVAAVYNLGGQRTNSMQKGVNIVKYNNGETVKVLNK